MNYQHFQLPPDGYGEVSFFWWHGDPITKEKLLWILEQLKDHHICGLQINYCHSDHGGRSYGLTMESDPKPFSEPWWELIKWFQAEANKRGMAVSLSDYTLSSPGQESFTDEILHLHPEYLGQILLYQANEAKPPEKFCDCQPLARTDHGTIFRAVVPCSLNPMYPGVGETYADVFYSAFERHMPGTCGTGLNFFFSDELNFNVRGMLWCDDFTQQFFQRKGYDLLPYLSDLFETRGTAHIKTRLDYADVIVQLSEERFFKPVYDWHEQRGMIFGCDHGGRGYDVTEFGDYFRAMRWYQGPGNDQPRLGSDLIKSKVSSSIAHLYERPRIWLEGFYSSGWQTSSADVADAIFRNYALGHNLLSLHGLYYSTYGSCWEWAPPCNHHHMPYWPEMAALLGCTERLSWLMTQGAHRCDIAIVYPVAAVEADPAAGKTAVNCAFDTARYLYAHGVDFDFIDFQSIVNGRIENGRLHAAQESYHTIVIPHMQAARFDMMEKLHDFAAQGGHVAVIGQVPTSSDRVFGPDPVLDEYVRHILAANQPYPNIEAFFKSMATWAKADILFPSCAQEPYFHHRLIDGEDLYLIYRVPEGASCGFHTRGKPVLLDPFTGKQYAINDYTCKGEYIHVPMITRFAGLMLLLFTPHADSLEVLNTGPYQEIPFTGLWRCMLDPTLDNTYGDYRLPVTQTFLGAEARDFDYRFDGDSTWSHATYSYAPYLYVCRGEADEDVLSQLNIPGEGFDPYHFSMRMGVEGDAGYQGSYHGLKGRISDDFIALGQKRLTYAGSSSVYEGEGPYYVMGWIRLGQCEMLVMHCGGTVPDTIWIDHHLTPLGEITLDAGLHVVLLKYTRACRTHFLFLRKDSPAFIQTMPLAMQWYQHPGVISFVPQPWHEGSACEFRLMAPPGTEALQLPFNSPCRITGEHGAWQANGSRHVPEQPLLTCEPITLRVEGEAALLGPALLQEPVCFTVGEGLMDVDQPIEAQGFKFYSGGMRYRKTISVDHSGLPVLLDLGTLDCAARIWVNGQEAGVLVAPPYTMDITALVTSGDNAIEILVHNTLRNHMHTIPTNFLFEQ